MHHHCIYKSVKTLSHIFYSYPPQRKVAPRIKYKSTRIHYTRAKVKKKMERLEQENKELREGMTAMQTEVEKLTALVNTLMAAQNQVSQTTSTVLEPVISAIPSSTTVTGISQTIIPEGFPWGMPHSFNEGPCPFGSTSITHPMSSSGYPWGMSHGFNEGFYPAVSEVPTPIIQQSTSVPQPSAIIPEPIVTYYAPLVQTDRLDRKPVFPTESVEAFDMVEGLQDTIDEMKREMKALRGKDAFGQNVQELCLVPNVVKA